jgi:glutaconyl-CoA decarboxylase
MHGETAAAAMYARRLVKDNKAGKDIQPIIDKMNELIKEYAEKSSPFYCEKDGFVDKIVDMDKMRSYIKAFAGAYYQNPKAVCPFHQMLTPRTMRDYETFVK